MIQDQQTCKDLIAAITSCGLPNLTAGSAQCMVGGIDETVDGFRDQIHPLVLQGQPGTQPAAQP